MLMNDQFLVILNLDIHEFKKKIALNEDQFFLVLPHKLLLLVQMFDIFTCL